jgi:hypothetical protein
MEKILPKLKKSVLLASLLIFIQFAQAQEIEVRGGGTIINDGGAGTPALNNLTNFGSTNEQGGTITKTFVINNIAAGVLNIGGFTIAGANASDFTVTRTPATPLPSFTGTTTFEVTFNPSGLGVRNATISFVNNDANENPFNFNISGTGTNFPTQSHTVYYENFEETNGGWASSGANGNWIWDNAIHRGEGNFWRTNSNYSNNALIYLTSPIINTNGFTNVKISLDIRFDTSNDLDDGMQVQYSIDGGTTWLFLGTNTENWYNSTTVTALNGSVGNRNGWNNTGLVIGAPFSQFEEKTMQYNLLDNQTTLRFRIAFASDGSNIDTGCAIDNVIVKADPITPFANPLVGPGNVNSNLKLWLKANAGTSTSTDGAALDTWNDQAFNNHADAIGVTRPTFRNGTRNINFNPIIDFSPASANVMKGKGGFWAQDYFVVVKTNNTLDSASPTRQVPISGRTSISSFHLDGTAFALGNFTARYVNELVSHSINSVPQTASTNSYGRSYSTTTDTYVQETIIFNVKTNATGTETEIYKNGKRIDNTRGQSVAADQVTFTGNLNFSEFSNLQYNLGTGRFSLNGNIGSYLDGKLSEIISYSSANSAANKKKIESYLAIKNGVTLHASNSVLAINQCDTDYVDSNGNIIWNFTANNGYNYDIAGIGRDDNTQLNQKQSKSENTGEVLTIGLGDINPTNSANTNTFATDRSYLVWGSNGLNMNNSGVNLNVDLGPTTITTITEVVNRRWKVVETGGDVATTRVAVPTAAFTSGLPALGPTDAYVMVVATNAAFTTGVETVFMSTTGSNQTCLYDFDGTKFITFGVAHRATNPLHITLDGNDDYVRIDNVNELGANFSIMTWIRPNGANDLGTERTIIAKKATATTGYQLVLQNDNRIRIEWRGLLGIAQSAVSNTVLPNAVWHNIAVTYGSESLRIYIDGVQDRSVTLAVPPVASTSTFAIGAQYVNKTTINNLFKGDIDELRMWNRVVTPAEIRFLMNQEIVQNGTGTRGTIIPATVTKNDASALLWSNLRAYYSMNSYIGTHLDDDSNNSNRGSLVIPDKISINVQTAPMPYESNSNGLWSSTATWRNGSIQDVAYSLSIVDGTTPIDWNIVRTNHNIDSNGNKVLLGLFTNSNRLSASNDSKIEVTHHLKLDGIIDLQGRSQLVQTLNSDLDPTSSGRIERDQQGSNNIYNYNYWSSPVGAINATTNNNAYTVSGVMKDGTTTTPQNITWTAGLNGSPTSPITLSSYWIFRFQNLSNSYANWQSVGSAGSLNPGQGYTLKGSGAAADQNFTFVGKPNNGAVTGAIAAGNLNLSGNPYASAIDASQFINDNSSSITGTLYFWQHSPTNNTHNLLGFQGGYASRNLVGGTAPVAPAGIAGVGTSAKVPGRFIPVGQGFFLVGSGTGGSVNFNNNQRLFVKEDNANSNTLFRNNATQNIVASNHFTNNANDDVIENEGFKKIRLGFQSSDNFYKQVLLGFMEENATSGLDYGYDALNIDTQLNDMYFVNNGAKLNIQGDGYFNVNNIYPIGIKNNAAGNVTFKIDEKENFDNDNFQAYIHDNVTNIYHNIRNVSFTINLPQGTIENRFSLTFKNTSALSNESFDNANGLLVVYSNANSILNIKNNVIDATVESVSLFNMLGQAITTWDVKDQNQQNIELPIKGLSTGTYIVKVKTTKGETSRKIIVN